MITIGVLALQGGFAEHVAALYRLGVAVVEVRLPEHLRCVDGLVIPGGESTAIVRQLHDSALHQPIQALVQKGMPVWGTCAGAILLAKTVDLNPPGLAVMDIAVQRNAFGRQIDSFQQSIPTVLWDTPFPAVFIRAPVFSVPDAAVEKVRVLAQLEDQRIVAAEQAGWLATAFHPELTDDDRFHRYFFDKVAACVSA